MNDPRNSDTLLASIAVFAELCDSSTDIQSIIIKFIKAIFTLENTYSLSVEEAVSGLKTHFEFEIPAAVVKTCLSKLVREGEVTRGQNRFTLVNPSENSRELSTKLDSKKTSQRQIEDDLILHCERVNKRSFTDDEKQEVTSRFIGCIFGNPASDEMAISVNSFVLENSANEAFVESLNEIREGIVLLTGLKYTNDLAELGRWPASMTVYLDTEILFNAAGFNGELYKRLFTDFHALIREINHSAEAKSGAPVIRLKYLASVKSDIERFFHSAERIVRREQNLSPESGAMEEILRGCNDASDVVRKQADFFTLLRNHRISEQEELDWLSRPDLNVEDASLMAKYRNIFPEEIVAETLHNFTKINFLRGGINRTTFERCGHVVMTGRYVTIQLSRDLEVKFDAADVPFATDMNFFTNRLWFRLNKGFSAGQNLPSSLDVVSNAQIAIAAQLNRSVKAKFDSLKSDLESGRITKENARSYNYHLREKARLPEQINISNLAETIDFIHDEANFQQYIETNISLREQSAELIQTKLEVRRYKIKEKHNLRRPILKRVLRDFRILVGAFEFLAIGLLLVGAAVVAKLISPGDSVIQIAGFVLQVGGGFWLGYKFVRPRAKTFLRQWTAKRYFDQLSFR
jgi:hypothetical protein